MKKVKVNLTPMMASRLAKEASIEISLKLQEFACKAGEMLFELNGRTIMKPFETFAVPLQITDEAGEVPFEKVEENRGYILAWMYKPLRDTKGEIQVHYTLALKPVGVNPCFDFGFEEGGIDGAGMTSMPAFAEESAKEQYDYTLTWDLSKMMENATAAWAFGPGTCHKVAFGGLLQQTFYAAGELNAVRFGRFGYYWFSGREMLQPAMDAARIFDYESEFFEDAEDPYNIFIRKTVGSERAGGTAYTRSYMCVYSEGNDLSPDWLFFLYAHEMVHNWVHLSDSPFGTCTWYVEGMAEFYSSVLPFRAGIASKEQLLKEINKRAQQYYQNPRNQVPNAEVGKHLMKDPEMTRVPYGRGFFYLTHADAMIRRATSGEKSLDDVVKALNKRYAEDKTLQNEAWIEEYGRYVGEKTAREEYEAMAQGKAVEPECDCYGGAVRKVKTEGVMRESGEKCVLWQFE